MAEHKRARDGRAEDERVQSDLKLQPSSSAETPNAETSPVAAGNEATPAEPQIIPVPPGNDLGSAPAVQVLPPERDGVTQPPLAPDAPYAYADLDDQTFHTTLSGFVEQAQGQYAEFGLTLYYRILPGVQDAERRLREHKGDPTYTLDGCRGIEEYIEKLGLKPATIRKWRQRDKERRFMREVKLLSGGSATCPECGRGKGHAPSCSRYHPELTALQAEVVQALVGQGYQEKDAVAMVKAAEGQDFNSLFKSALTHRAGGCGTGTAVIDAQESDDQAESGDQEPSDESLPGPGSEKEPTPNSDETLVTVETVPLDAANALKTALANEPDRVVASEMLTEYLQTVAAQFADGRITIKEVVATVVFAGRDHRIMPGDWLEKRDKNAPPTLCKCVGIAEFMHRRKVQEWSGGKWGTERVICSGDESDYRVIAEARARLLAPEAFPTLTTPVGL